MFGTGFGRHADAKRVSACRLQCRVRGGFVAGMHTFGVDACLQVLGTGLLRHGDTERVTACGLPCRDRGDADLGVDVALGVHVLGTGLLRHGDDTKRITACGLPDRERDADGLWRNGEAERVFTCGLPGREHGGVDAGEHMLAGVDAGVQVLGTEFVMQIEGFM